MERKKIVGTLFINAKSTETKLPRNQTESNDKDLLE